VSSTVSPIEMEFAVDRAHAAPRRPHRGRDSASWPTSSDGELLVAIAEGDHGAFEQLHGRYATAMLGLALHRLRDRGRAEDAVQEAFAAIWRAAGTYRPDRGPGAPWVYAVARNAITTRWRKRPEPAVEPLELPSLEAGPAEQAEQAWRSFCVHRALESLPDEQRRLIELAYWSDLSQSEIAERLGLPLGTVKTRTRAALKRLAEALKEDMQ
jgi:RNA polymerase sigma-70 factor, ECF subfamily